MIIKGLNEARFSKAYRNVEGVLFFSLNDDGLSVGEAKKNDEIKPIWCIVCLGGKFCLVFTLSL